MSELKVHISRGGILLEPDLTDEREVEGILNPAVAGNYLLYRAVGKGNFSRIMIAELHSEKKNGGTLISARRLHRVALEPQEPYELAPTGRGGIEDPRVTRLPDGGYVMFYTGYGRPAGFAKQTPVVAVATSQDGLNWRREGRLVFASHQHGDTAIDFNVIPNKDTVLYSEKIQGRYALLHRPMFTHEQATAFGVPRRGIWYAMADRLEGPWDNHVLLLRPEYGWEGGGVGAGVPPIHLRHTWVHVYHGFTKKRDPRRYSAGVFITKHDDPTHVVYRSRSALLEPVLPKEQVGVVPHVVFPTAVWQEDQVRTTLGLFWGAADTRIMWGILHLPSAVLGSSAFHAHVS